MSNAYKWQKCPDQNDGHSERMEDECENQMNEEEGKEQRQEAAINDEMFTYRKDQLILKFFIMLCRFATVDLFALVESFTGEKSMIPVEDERYLLRAIYGM